MTRTQIVGAVAFTALAVALVIGTTITDADGRSTPLVTTVLGFIGIAVAQILNQAKTNKTNESVEQLNHDLRNGTFEKLIRKAVEDIAHDERSNLEIKQEGRDGNG